eukprot:1467380-Rhodomonas_salina.2
MEEKEGRRRKREDKAEHASGVCACETRASERASERESACLCHSVSVSVCLCLAARTWQLSARSHLHRKVDVPERALTPPYPMSVPHRHA